MNWRAHAKCAGTDPNQYDLTSPKRTLREKRDIAAELCGGCPVMKDCAKDALDYGDAGMVRGGVWVEGQNGISAGSKAELHAVARRPRH